MMGHSDRSGLHWHPPALGEREVLFDQVDRFLAAAAATAGRTRPDEPTPAIRGCPDCASPLARHFRYGPGGVDYCENCGWEECPF